MRRLGALGAFDAVQSEFIDDQEFRAPVVADALREGFIGEGSGQIGEQGRRGTITDAVPATQACRPRASPYDALCPRLTNRQKLD